MARDAVPLKKLVIIEESTIAAMASDTQFVKEFPFLASIARVRVARGGCGKCGQASKARAMMFGAAKRAIAGLDGTKKRRLKELLGTGKARVRFRSSAGHETELTF